MKKVFSLLLCTLSIFMIAFPFYACGKEEVKVKYYSSGAEVLPLMRQGVIEYAVLPEPAATQITKVASNKTWYRLDLQEEYDSETKSYPQAVIMAKTSLLYSHPEVVQFFADNLNNGVEWAKSNVSTAISAINGKLADGVTPTFNSSNLNADIITRSKVFFESVADSKIAVKNYIDDIISVGDGISEPAVSVSDDFFYEGTLQGTEYVKSTIDVFCPDGAPALSIAKMINDGSTLGTDLAVNFHVVSAGDIGQKMATGAGDIVILPVNAGTKLYKKNTDAYKMIGVCTHGNLYLMSSEQVTIGDLAGKTVGVIGQGLVPDLTFRSVLKKYNLTIGIKE